MINYSRILILFFIQLIGTTCIAQTKIDTLKGSITKERAWWDIQRYDLTINPDLQSKWINGKNIIQYNLVGRQTNVLMQIDLVAPLKIDSVFQNGKQVPFKQFGDIWYLTINQKQQPKFNQLTIYYSGKPTESINPPWDGGVVWSKDSLGRPWVSVACQYKGASLWYPCKNALYDEPDNGASISVVVPDSLIAVANGKLVKRLKLDNKRAIYQWAVKNPINHYGISFYIGNYIQLQDFFKGEKGLLTMNYWVLDYHKYKAEAHLIKEAKNTMRALEYWFGPYPFYNDEFKIVDAPYIGMEHQSAIAYGSSYRTGTNLKGGDISNTGWGKKTDKIVVHEMAHEWFGNSITASDIADRWIQEGFAGLAEELVIAKYWGNQAGAEFMAGRFRTIENDKPVIARYGINEDGSQDNYIKGWALLHMIRTIINDENLFIIILRGLNSEFKNKVVSSSDIERYISLKSNIQFKPLFDQYLRTAQIPILQCKIKGSSVEFKYVNCNVDFNMPIKTNWTGDNWLYPTTNWQTINLSSVIDSIPLKINPNFYLKLEIEN